MKGIDITINDKKMDFEDLSIKDRVYYGVLVIGTLVLCILIVVGLLPMMLLLCGLMLLLCIPFIIFKILFPEPMVGKSSKGRKEAMKRTRKGSE